uniref:Uncharacterized protein n=1 Tax=Oryza brachyantha TaxID=4533 RepID=J3NC18_ORYBR
MRGVPRRHGLQQVFWREVARLERGDPEGSLHLATVGEQGWPGSGETAVLVDELDGEEKVVGGEVEVMRKGGAELGDGVEDDVGDGVGEAEAVPDLAEAVDELRDLLEG